MSASSRHLLSLPLDTALRSKLICCAFSAVEDFKGYDSVEALKKAVNITENEAKHVLNVIQPYINSSSLRPRPNTCGVFEAQLSTTVVMKSAAHLLKENLKRVRHIVSFSSEVDRLMGGGFPLGRITEIAGEAGLGKTQFCLQLCVDVQIPACLGGVDGEAVFLDVEGTFFPQRVAQITAATVKHCQNITEFSEDSHCLAALQDFTTEKIMSHIYLFSCRNCVQLLAAAHQMKEFLKAHPKVKLLVVDTVAQSVRGEEDMRSRSKYLTTLGRIFRDIIVDFDIAVVLTNQVTTKIIDNGHSYNIPALGTKWSHLASVKLMLHRHNGCRYVHQYKSPDMCDGIAEYRVVSEGIRDAEYAIVKIHQEQTSRNSERQKEKFCSQIETETSANTQATSSVHFYPITQGIATEMMNEWEIQEDNPKYGNTQNKTDSDKILEFPTEEIPDKWIELSQRQLCESLHERPDDISGNIVESSSKVLIKERGAVKINSIKENGEKLENIVPKSITSSQNLRIKTQAVLRQTVDTLLFCESPARKAPKSKRKSDDAKELNLNDAKRFCDVRETENELILDENHQDNSVRVRCPSSPILENKTKKLKKSLPERVT